MQTTIPALRWHRCETRVPAMLPFVDWYQAADEADALALAKADAVNYGVDPRATFAVRLATDAESARLSES